MSDHDPTTPVEYREIPECPNYRFGSDGSVWRAPKSGRWGKPDWHRLDTGGKEKRVWVVASRSGSLMSVPHVIAWAFHGRCPKGKRAVRLNGDSTDNRPANLVWGTGTELADAGVKLCRSCKAVKPLGDFSPHKAMIDGRQSHCKACSCASYKAFASTPEGKAKVKVWHQRARLKYRYGITDVDYARMLAEQGGVCAICGKPPRGLSKSARLHVDHCHATGVVRGLTCTKCNTAMGTFGDTVAGLQRVIDYLKRSTPNAPDPLP